jgi:small conductance mechanosensitive channel
LTTIASFDQCLKDPPSRIGLQKFDADGYIIVINVWTKAHGFQDTKLAFQEQLLKNFKAAGIKLPGMN